MMVLAEEKVIASKKKQQRIIGSGVLLAVMTIAVLFIFLGDGRGILERVFAAEANITLTSPAPVAASKREEIVIDAVVANLPDQEYPAASLSVHFDRNKLEFVGVRQGTMKTRGRGGIYHIPIWNSDVEASNQHGIVNTMYLDLTGGDHPYIVGEEDILVRLVFRLRDSVESGETHHITIYDAVFATVNPADSVATSKGNLRVHHAQIIVR